MSIPSQTLMLLLIATIFPLIGVAGGCVPEDLVQGCRIEDKRCVCGLGCDTIFKYATREQCQIALKEQRGDACQPSPCLNNGVCIPTWRHHGYYCVCANTGYYGHTCHTKCPRPEEFTKEEIDESYPIECMVI